jgi:hypothetical protein
MGAICSVFSASIDDGLLILVSLGGDRLPLWYIAGRPVTILSVNLWLIHGSEHLKAHLGGYQKPPFYLHLMYCFTGYLALLGRLVKDLN